jgi:NAD(P)-dependent dehydrogenase (short-subunit alcohol dehydrogenase family)
VVVVGGSSGIGLGVARAARDAGAAVVVVGRSQPRLEQAVAFLNAGTPRGDLVDAVAADVTQEDDVRRLFEVIGPCDHVASTAADLVYQPVRELDVAAARRAIDSKLVGALLLAKYGVQHLSTDGSLTFTSGIAATRPAPRGAVTAAVNSAMGGLARALALELAPLRVNVVSPGWVDTPIWDAVAGGNKGAVQAAMATRLPVRRLGTPEDLAQAYLFLMQNGFATGTIVHVDGGHRLV